METHQTLENIAQNYNFVIFDTSILDATKAERKLREEYRSKLLKTLNEYDNIFTISEVRLESKGYTSPRYLKTMSKRRLLYYDDILAYIKPLAEGLNITRMSKEYPLTDLRLATLTLALSFHIEKTAFLSSDRELNKFIYFLIHRIKNEEHPRFPKKINQLDVYSFIQKKASFVLTE